MRGHGTPLEQLQFRAGTVADLDALNGVIEHAIMTWQLPERVKRLSLPSYRYSAQDFVHLAVMLAELNGQVLGVAALESAEQKDVPAGTRGLLLHGLYVEPRWHHRGIGRALVDVALAAARERGLGGLLVKAQRDAEPFFQACGFARMPVVDAARDYAGRFWHPV